MLKRKKAREIIAYARQLKSYWHTNNPYELAAILGCQINERESCYPDFTAQIVRIEGYPTVISINKAYDEFSKKVLCAHELGHAIFHADNVCNHFAGSATNIENSTEHEANLFAIALLTDDNIDSRLIIPLDEMCNFMLKSIMDRNIHKQTVS